MVFLKFIMELVGTNCLTFLLLLVEQKIQHQEVDIRSIHSHHQELLQSLLVPVPLSILLLVVVEVVEQTVVAEAVPEE